MRTPATYITFIRLLSPTALDDAPPIHLRQVFLCLDGKILFCEVALLHPKQFIHVLATRHPDTTRDDSLLFGVFYAMLYTLLLRVR